MKKSAAIVVIIVVIVVFILLIAMAIAVSTAGGYLNAVKGTTDAIGVRANNIVAGAGGLDNAIATTVENATTPQPLAGAGAITGSNYASTPKGADTIIVTRSVDLESTRLTVGKNGTTTLVYIGITNNTPSNNIPGAFIVLNPQNKIGGKIIVANQSSGSIGIGASNGVYINGNTRTLPDGSLNPNSIVIINSNTYVTFTATDLNRFISSLPQTVK